MEPRIQYAQTVDGVSIAYYTLGEGMPVVHMPVVPWSHIQIEWQIPELRNWYERLAHKRKLVRYDSRGSGLSDREVADYSLEGHVLDLEAVVDRVGLERFALLATLGAGYAAIMYAARQPERVSHVVLWHGYARESEIRRSPLIEVTLDLAQKDWHTFLEAVAQQFHGYWSAGDVAHRIAGFMRQAVTQETFFAVISEFRDVDVTPLLPEVTAPTLVLHRREAPLYPVDLARGLASQIPNARLALLEGSSWGPWIGDLEAVHRTIDEFLGEGEEPRGGAEPLAKEDVHTILFTDMEDSTTLTQRLGDAKAQEVLRTHNRIVRDALKAHSGSEIKHTGDGIMASFASASRALECAIDIQRALVQHNESNPDTPIRVRIGLNAGEPVAEEGDLFGTAVQLAARIAAKAEGEEILVSDTLRGLVAGKGFLFTDRGDVALRGFEDPVRLFEVRWREEG